MNDLKKCEKCSGKYPALNTFRFDPTYYPKTDFKDREEYAGKTLCQACFKNVRGDKNG